MPASWDTRLNNSELTIIFKVYCYLGCQNVLCLYKTIQKMSLLHCGTLFISLPADTISQSAPLYMDQTEVSKGRSDETQLREFYKHEKTSNYKISLLRYFKEKLLNMSVFCTLFIHCRSLLPALWCERLCTESVNATAFILSMIPLQFCS